jgi:hypothetical protein
MMRLVDPPSLLGRNERPTVKTMVIAAPSRAHGESLAECRESDQRLAFKIRNLNGASRNMARPAGFEPVNHERATPVLPGNGCGAADGRQPSLY